MAFVACRVRLGIEVFSVEYQAPKGGPNSKRLSIYLGKDARTRAAADEVCKHVDAIIYAVEHEEPIARVTKLWLKAIEGKPIHAKLVAKGLVATEVEQAQAQAADAMTLKELADRFMQSGVVATKKPRTRLKYQQAIDCLLRYWTDSQKIREITVGDAEEWQAWIYLNGNARNKEDKTLSPATVGRRTKLARQLFRFAGKHKWLEENPFLSLKVPSDENEDRLVYVPTSVVDEVIDVAPDAEWRLLIALARYGGLRIPSEIQRMTWEHIDFANGRMTLHAPKTEHHRGKGKRVCPIFPELRPYLEDMAEIAKGKPATNYVLPNIRKITNPSTRFHDLVAMAGYESWERIFQNLRASRATDLLQAGHPIKTVSKWVGNSPEVLMAHYAQVTDYDFEKALGDTLTSATEEDDSKSPPFSPPSMGILGTSGTIRRKPEEARKGGKSKENKEIPRWARNRKGKEVGRQGLEPRTKGL